MRTIKELRERTKASAATRAKLLKPLDKKTKRGIKVKVKNMISDLDHIAWQFENQLDVSKTHREGVVEDADNIRKKLEDFSKLYF